MIAMYHIVASAALMLIVSPGHVRSYEPSAVFWRVEANVQAFQAVTL